MKTRTSLAATTSPKSMAWHLRTACAARLLPLLLVLTLPSVVHAQFNYTINSGAVTITGYTGPGGAVTIPSTISGLPVTTIGVTAFYNSVGLTSVTIPNSVATLQSGSFKRCTSLTSVTMGNGVASIEQEAFASCTSLTGITVNAANPSYSSVDGVLFDKKQTVLVVFPGGKAGTYAVPNGVTNILFFAFLGCAGLTQVTLPNSLTSVGFAAFFGCHSLSSVAIPNSVTSLEMSAFEDCFSLISITLPNSVTTIGNAAFHFCTNLTSVTIGSGVTSIEDSAFRVCRALKSVYFRGNAPTVAPSAFDLATNTVYYLPGTTGWGALLAGRPTVLWNPQMPTTGATFGVRTNRFGFSITGTADIPIVVEACADLSSPVWVPLQTCALTNGLLYFSDSQWTNYPGRYYRLRSP